MKIREVLRRASELAVMFMLAIPLYFVCSYLGEFTPLVMLVAFMLTYATPWKE